MLRFSLALALAVPLASAAPVIAAEVPASSHQELVSLFAEWRAFNHPSIVRGRPDYGPAAMAAKAAGLNSFKQRLAAIDTSGWSASQKGDYRYVEAEMNGLDFFLRVLKPWARDPGFYQTIFPEMSDVPAHEGPSAEPNIDLFRYSWPLSKADDARLTELIGAVPALLADAKLNLAQSDAHDLWAYGDRAFTGQAKALADLEAGTLTLNDLEGRRTVSLNGASPRLKAAVRAARLASEDFAAWVRTEAPKRTGPSGVGKDNYNWWLKHVLLSPLDFDQQVVLLQRELDRSLASLRLEEVRNRAAPPIPELTDPAAYKRMALAREERIYRLLVDGGFIEDRAYYRNVFSAIDNHDWARVQATLAQRSDGLLTTLATAEFYTAANSPKVSLEQIEQWLQKGSRLPEAEHPNACARARSMTALCRRTCARRCWTGSPTTIPTARGR